MHQPKVKLSALHCGIYLVQHVLLYGAIGWKIAVRGHILSPNHPHVSHLAVDQVFLNDQSERKIMTDIICSASHWKQKVTSSALHCRIGNSIPCSVGKQSGSRCQISFLSMDIFNDNWETFKDLLWALLHIVEAIFFLQHSNLFFK